LTKIQGDKMKIWNRQKMLI